MKTRSILLLCSFFVKGAVLLAIPMMEESGFRDQQRHPIDHTHAQQPITCRAEQYQQGSDCSLGMTSAAATVMEDHDQKDAVETDSSRREDQTFVVADRNSSGRYSGIGMKKNISSEDLTEIDEAAKETMIDAKRLEDGMRVMPQDDSVRELVLAANARAHHLDEIAAVLNEYDTEESVSWKFNQRKDDAMKKAADEATEAANAVRKAIANAGLNLGSFDDNTGDVDHRRSFRVRPEKAAISLGKSGNDLRAVTIAMIHTAIGRSQSEMISPYPELDRLWVQSRKAWDHREAASREQTAAENAYKAAFVERAKEQAAYDAVKLGKTGLGKCVRCATVASAIGGCFNIPIINIAGICNGLAVLCGEVNEFSVGHRLRKAEQEESNALQRQEAAAAVLQQLQKLAPELDDKVCNAEEQAKQAEIKKSKKDAAFIKLPREPHQLNRRFWKKYSSRLVAASAMVPSAAALIASQLEADHSWLDAEVEEAWKKRIELSGKYVGDLQDSTSFKQQKLNDLNAQYQQQTANFETVRNVVRNTSEQFEQIQKIKEAAKKELKEANDDLNQLNERQDEILMNSAADSQTDATKILQEKNAIKKRIRIAKRQEESSKSMFDAAQEDMQRHNVEFINQEKENIKLANEVNNLQIEIDRDIERANVRVQADHAAWLHYWGGGATNLTEEVVEERSDFAPRMRAASSIGYSRGICSAVNDFVARCCHLSSVMMPNTVCLAVRGEEADEMRFKALCSGPDSEPNLLSEVADGESTAAISRLVLQDSSPSYRVCDEYLQHHHALMLEVALSQLSMEEEKKDDAIKALEGEEKLQDASRFLAQIVHPDLQQQPSIMMNTALDSHFALESRTTHRPAFKYSSDLSHPASQLPRHDQHEIFELTPPSPANNISPSLDKETPLLEMTMLKQALGLDKSSEEVEAMCAAPARAAALAQAAKNELVEVTSPEETLTGWDTAIGYANEAQQGYEAIMTACETALAQESENRDLIEYASEVKSQAAHWKIQASYYKMEQAADAVDIVRDQLTEAFGAKDRTDLLEKMYAVVSAYHELAETCKNTLQENRTASNRFRSSWIRKLREAEKGQGLWQDKARTCKEQNKTAMTARAKTIKAKKQTL